MSATRYRLSVWITVPNDEDGQPEIDKLPLERAMYQYLKRYEYDCDVEVMDSEQVEEP